MVATARKTVAGLTELREFLGCATPPAWLERARTEPALLLIDHANCEHKAAATALTLIRRYPDQPALVYRMSRLAREELRHFEQVQQHIVDRGIKWQHVPASAYAAGLRSLVRAEEPGKLVDLLVCGAFIEARSCERFDKLCAVVDADLARFYGGLLASEARHFQQYLALARDAAVEADIDARIAVFRDREAELIQRRDTNFAFHSGVPDNL